MFEPTNKRQITIIDLRANIRRSKNMYNEG